jgi:hypothetical protein
MAKYNNRKPNINEAGYDFVCYLNEEGSRGIFNIGDSLEIWETTKDPNEYGFTFNNCQWKFNKVVEG